MKTTMSEGNDDGDGEAEAEDDFNDDGNRDDEYNDSVVNINGEVIYLTGNLFSCASDGTAAKYDAVAGTG